MLWGKISSLVLTKDPSSFKSRMSHIKRRIGERLAGDHIKLYSPKNNRRKSNVKKKKATELKHASYSKNDKKVSSRDIMKLFNDESKVLSRRSIPEEVSEESFSIKISPQRMHKHKSPNRSSVKLSKYLNKKSGLSSTSRKDANLKNIINGQAPKQEVVKHITKVDNRLAYSIKSNFKGMPIIENIKQPSNIKRWGCCSHYQQYSVKSKELESEDATSWQFWCEISK